MTKPKKPKTEPNLYAFMKTLDPKLSDAQMRAAVKAKGYTPGPTTVSAYRSKLGLTKPHASPKSAARPGGSTAHPHAGLSFSLREAVPSKPDYERAFRESVARIGTDRARELLEQAEQREIE